jgi:hypothetical protein
LNRKIFCKIPCRELKEKEVKKVMPIRLRRTVRYLRPQSRHLQVLLTILICLFFTTCPFEATSADREKKLDSKRQIKEQLDGVGGTFPEDLPGKIDVIYRAVTGKGRGGQVGWSNEKASFPMNLYLLPMSIFLSILILILIVIQIYRSSRSHRTENSTESFDLRSNTPKNISNLKEQNKTFTLNPRKHELANDLKEIHKSLAQLNTLGLRIEETNSLLSHQQHSLEAVEETVSLLEERILQLRKDLVLGSDESPAVLTILDRVESVRKLLMSHEKSVSATKSLGTRPPRNSEKSVPRDDVAYCKKDDAPKKPKGNDEKEDRVNIKFNLDEI